MAKTPNIVFLLADDLGYSDLSCYGSSFYETPCLDAMARDGMRFTNAYAACPVCSPTRASLLTGKYPARVGMTNWIYGQERGKLLEVPFIDHLPETEYTLPAALRAQDYQTWHVGKWHLGDESLVTRQGGFDTNFGGCHWGHPKGGYFAPFGNPCIDDTNIPQGTYLDDVLVNRAVEQIQHRDTTRPFFLNLWFYLVHTPCQAPQPLVDKYTQKAASMGLGDVNPFSTGEKFPCEHKKEERVIRRVIQSDPTYAAMVEKMDAGVGTIVETLRKEGVLEDTIVVFSSDNGGLSTAEGSPTCNHPLREGKGWLQEGGVREPLIVRYPCVVPKNQTTDALFTSPDLYPTLLSLAGLDARPDQHLDGMDISPALRGEAFERGAIYWHYPHYGNQGGTPCCAMRQGNFKLIERFDNQHIALYDLAHDPSETRDLSTQFPVVVARMYAKLALWRDTEVCGRIPVHNPAYVPWD